MKVSVLIIGVGDLGGRVLDLLVRLDGIGKIIIAGRDEEYLHRKKNLSMFAALQLGYYPDLAHVKMDIDDIDHTAETILKLKPDIVFNAATRQALWRVLAPLPREVSEELGRAQLGPWLPVHLTLVHKLMQAVKNTGLDCRVVNAAFPDAVHPVLAKWELAPTIGVGHVGDIIPALRKSISLFLKEPVEKVEVLFVAQHYITHFIPRFGYPVDAPCYLKAMVDGSDVTGRLDLHRVYGALTKQLAQTGTEAQIITATSATRIIEAMANNTRELVHAPGPNGLPGGYPVKVDAKGGAVWLPETLSFEEAIRINEEGQRADGIDRIDMDGTVHFVDKPMGVMKRILGYQCKTMKVEESEGYARELVAKSRELVARYSGSSGLSDLLP
uniref:Saccharopine dehydrogenase NADP binding domain-containing protein n=1 Tax=Candidatus Kentrum sp. LFY TaxID=2126342 RepID=A0A450V2R4_9GAMM|nr:MAG: hypothetical protein BECKLFY1418B_GA0070995_11363 [Candidatus Kentron sp. LFY]